MAKKTGISIAQQGWLGIAVWMSIGLLLEGLMAFRSPVYLLDPVRREMFRLAHAHGTILSILLLVADIYAAKLPMQPPAAAMWCLRIGTVLMPVGFFAGGIVHYESDPGLGVFLAPIGGVLVIFGAIVLTVSSFRKIDD